MLLVPARTEMDASAASADCLQARLHIPRSDLTSGVTTCELSVSGGGGGKVEPRVSGLGCMRSVAILLLCNN